LLGQPGKSRFDETGSRIALILSVKQRPSS
jgi:hypothetical protein